jgi:hypothetical protein
MACRACTPSFGQQGNRCKQAGVRPSMRLR